MKLSQFEFMKGWIKALFDEGNCLSATGPNLLAGIDAPKAQLALVATNDVLTWRGEIAHVSLAVAQQQAVVKPNAACKSVRCKYFESAAVQWSVMKRTRQQICLSEFESRAPVSPRLEWSPCHSWCHRSSF